MDVTDEQRAVLRRELDRVLGTEATTIMMAHLPQGGQDQVANVTRDDFLGLVRSEDLAEFGSRMDRQFEQVQRFHLDLIERMASLESRIEVMGQSIRAEIRGELVAAVTGQTKSLIISLMGALAIVSGLAFAIAANVQP